MEMVMELRDYLNGRTKIKAVLLTLLISCGITIMLYKNDIIMESETVKETIAVFEKSTTTGGIDAADKRTAAMTKTENVIAKTENAVKTEKIVITEDHSMQRETTEPVMTPDKVPVIEEIFIPETMVKTEESIAAENVAETERSPKAEDMSELEFVAVPEEKADESIGMVPETEEEVPALPEMTSAFLIDEAGMIYGFLPEYAQEIDSGYLEFPAEGCVGVRRGTFAGCGSNIFEVYVTGNITNIEDGALNEILTLEWISADAGNPVYTSVDGILFDITGTKLISFPPARTGAYAVPEGVTEIAENAFLNTSLDTIDLRECGLDENCLLNISESCSIIR